MGGPQLEHYQIIVRTFAKINTPIPFDYLASFKGEHYNLFKKYNSMRNVPWWDEKLRKRVTKMT